VYTYFKKNNIAYSSSSSSWKLGKALLTGANNAKKLRLKIDTKTYTVNTAT